MTTKKQLLKEIENLKTQLNSQSTEFLTAQDMVRHLQVEVAKTDGTVLWELGVDPLSEDYWGTGSKAGEWTQDFIDAIQDLSNADLASLVGKTRTVEVNGVAHTVRVIGYNHDALSDGSGNTAKLTFEFANLISDANGNSLTTTWDGDGYTSGINYDYLNSNVFYNLEHLTPATASVSARTTTYNTYSYGKGNWYQKAGTAPTTDTAYANKSVYEMLPTTLTDNIKQVQKTVATSSSKSTSGLACENYNCKLFLPTYRETTASGTSTYQKEEGSAYDYYTGTYDTNAARIKKQVSGDTAYTSSATATGKGGTVYNYAGYNYKADATGGGYCWLASPLTNGSYGAWRCNNTGSLGSNDVYSYAYGVAPCFCI